MLQFENLPALARPPTAGVSLKVAPPLFQIAEKPRLVSRASSASQPSYHAFRAPNSPTVCVAAVTAVTRPPQPLGRLCHRPAAPLHCHTLNSEIAASFQHGAGRSQAAVERQSTLFTAWPVRLLTVCSRRTRARRPDVRQITKQLRPACRSPRVVATFSVRVQRLSLWSRCQVSQFRHFRLELCEVC